MCSRTPFVTIERWVSSPICVSSRQPADSEYTPRPAGAGLAPHARGHPLETVQLVIFTTAKMRYYEIRTRSLRNIDVASDGSGMVA
jgi:hypothetical protein